MGPALKLNASLIAAAASTVLSLAVGAFASVSPSQMAAIVGIPNALAFVAIHWINPLPPGANPIGRAQQPPA